MKTRSPALSILGVVVLLCVFGAANPASALDGGGNRAVRQLSRGVANILGGVTEVPVTIHRVTQEEGHFAGLTLGTLKGLGRFLTREVVGVVEVVTFPMGREPIIEPEFPMEQDSLNRWHYRGFK